MFICLCDIQMKLSRRFFIIVALLGSFFASFFTVCPVSAAEEGTNDFTKTSFQFSVCSLLGVGCGSSPAENIKMFLEKISTLLLALITVLAVLFIVIGGIFWSLSGVSPDFVTKGKAIIMTNLQAVGIATLSYFIVNLVLWILGN